MGLMEIHDPDALCCFSGVTHCPWCGKEGQNEGTVVNHLQTVHHRLGLVCDRLPIHQLHLSNHQEKWNHLGWESKQGGQDVMVYPRLPYWEYPHPLLQS